MHTKLINFTPDDEADFILCARHGELDDLRDYIEKGMALSVRDDHGNTALHMAAANGHDEALRILLSKCDVSVVSIANEEGNTALHWAAINGRAEAATLLVEAGGDLNAHNKADHSPIYEALANDKHDVAGLLMARLEAQAASDNVTENQSNGDIGNESSL